MKGYVREPLLHLDQTEETESKELENSPTREPVRPEVTEGTPRQSKEHKRVHKDCLETRREGIVKGTLFQT